MDVDGYFEDIKILNIKNNVNDYQYESLSLYKGFPITHANGTLLHRKGNIVKMGHLEIYVSTEQDARKLMNKIVEICI